MSVHLRLMGLEEQGEAYPASSPRPACQRARRGLSPPKPQDPVFDEPTLCAGPGAKGERKVIRSSADLQITMVIDS